MPVSYIKHSKIIDKNTIEYIGLSLYYYFIYPVYTYMSNVKIIAILIVSIIIITMAFLSANKQEKRSLTIFILCTILLFFITSVARYATLSTCINNYTCTFPRRYYYTLNILTLIPTFLSIQILMNSKKIIKKILSSIIIFILLFNIFIFSHLLFNDKTTVLFTFKQHIIEAYTHSSSFNSMYTINIEPPDWFINIPIQYVEATIK